MMKTYLLTIWTIGVEVSQIRSMMSQYDSNELFCKEFIDWNGRNIIEFKGFIILDETILTEDIHAVIFRKCTEYNPFLKLLQTSWRDSQPLCPKCFELLDNCICEFLADYKFMDDEEDK